MFGPTTTKPSPPFFPCLPFFGVVMCKKGGGGGDVVTKQVHPW